MACSLSQSRIIEDSVCPVIWVRRWFENSPTHSPFLLKVSIYPPMIHEIVKLFKDLRIPLWCFLKMFSICFETEHWNKLASRPTCTLFTCCSLFNLIRLVGVMSRMTIRCAYYCTDRVLHSVDLTLSLLL